MRNLIIVFILSLVSISTFAQFEQSASDTTTTSQPTRAQTKYMGGLPYMVQKGVSPKRIGLYSEIIAAGSGGVQQVNSISPTSGNVNITFANLLSKPTTVSGFGISDALSSGGSYTNPSWLVSIPFSKLTSTPTTLAGYSITDAVNNTGSYANPAFITNLAAAKVTGLATVATSGSYADIGSKPTTLAGYGITDAVNNTGAYANPAFITSLAWSKVSSTPTTISGYGITDAATTTALALKADATAVVPYSSVSAYSGLTGVTAPASGYLKFVRVTTDAQYGETNSLYYIDSAGKILKVATIKEN